MVLEMSLERMLDRIGHDGSEIIYPDLPEPRCRRSFHVQECLQVLDALGYAATAFDAIGMLVTDDVHQTEISFATDFENHLQTSNGVIMGQGCHNRHAVAIADKMIYDPNGYEYDWDSLIDHINRGVFIPQTFYKVKEI